MTVQSIKTKVKSKTAIQNKAMIKSRKKKKKGKKSEIKNKVNSNLLITVIFFTGVFLIISSYAWLSASLNVKVKFFDLVVSTDNGLFISLDGIDYTDSVEISMNSLINDLKTTYPSNTNQWAINGLWPVSSNGIKDASVEKFSIYSGELKRIKGSRDRKRYLTTKLLNEDNASPLSAYIAFDIFLKNVSGSPKSDNLYFDSATLIDFAEDTPDDIKTSLRGVMNSMRFGVVKIGSVSSKADVKTIQNIQCNNNCEMLIYEPNKTLHSIDSINAVKEAYGVNMVDGVYSPTYAVISEGVMLEHSNGQEGSGIPLDTEHFTLQNTITEADFEKPIFEIPNGVTKARIYLWIEGQDMDSIETAGSKGADLYLSIDFIKDLAGYE